jgi:hypothetical protein
MADAPQMRRPFPFDPRESKSPVQLCIDTFAPAW